MRFVSCSLVCLAAVSTASANPYYEGPCDILRAAGNPCVAAHSMTRALALDWLGKPLYKFSNGTWTFLVKASASDGRAEVTEQHEACGGQNTCEVVRIYDQSGKLNDLQVAEPGPDNCCATPDGGGAQCKLPLLPGEVQTSADENDDRDLPRRRARGVDAMQASVSLGGRPVHGAWFNNSGPPDIACSGVNPWFGYRAKGTTGVALGNEPETIFMVIDPKHYNGQCCFDYGNAENDAGWAGSGGVPGTMNALQWGTFGKSDGLWAKERGAVPTLAADLEAGSYINGANLNSTAYINYPGRENFRAEWEKNGNFFTNPLQNKLDWWPDHNLNPWTAGSVPAWKGENAAAVDALTAPGVQFLTGVLKHGVAGVEDDVNSTVQMTLRGGDATNATALQTLYAGKRPEPGYWKLQKAGAIVLGMGGNSAGKGAGTFYEGFMTRSATSEETDAKVQANIANAGYAARSVFEV